MKFTSFFTETQYKDRTVYKLVDKSLSKKFIEMNNEIVNKYSINIQNRNAIIKSLIQFLSQGTIYENQYDVTATKQSFYIIKTDICNFFPSIDKHRLYQKLVRSSMLSNSTLTIIKSFIFNSKISGIPLGMSFSNSLAEIYLEEFDDIVRQELDPIFYVRYVDDIVIIKHSSERNNVINNDKNKLFELLHNIGLSANKQKTDIYKYNNNNIDFDFLGYNFQIKNEKLVIDISEEKFKKKILNKLIRCFKNYYSSNKNDSDFWILYYRLKNLIYGVTSKGENGEESILKFGIAFSYKFINSDIIIKRFLKTFHYYRKKYSSYFTSYQNAMIFSLITVEKNLILNENSNPEHILLLLQKRINYTRMSEKKLNKISQQIGCNNIKVTMNGLDKYNLQVQIMKKLRLK